VSSLSSKEKRRQAITRFYQETSSKMILWWSCEEKIKKQH
jgi:hypothetical protein